METNQERWDTVDGSRIGTGHPKTEFSAQRRFIYPRGTKVRE